MADPKSDLHGYLKVAREAILWKLDGVSEYDARRPLVRTGSNLLGVVKHLALVESGYFGAVFGRPFPDDLDPFVDESVPNPDMWLRVDESREAIVDLYRRVWAHSDATIEALPLDAVGEVPWWPEDRRRVTLHRILVHMTTETHRHAGHVDILRELIDGAAGLRAGNDNLPAGDEAWWASYRELVERTAREAAGLD